MSKRTFTDELGHEYELALPYESMEGYTVIKPIPKAVEKKEYRVYMDIRDEPGVIFQKTDLKLSEPQAVATAAMLEAVMDYVQASSKAAHPYIELVEAARAALQKEGA